MPLARLPSWLEKRLVGDDAFASAYDALSDHERGVLKLAIARLAAVHGGRDELAERSLRSFRQGFSCLRVTAPARWTLIFWDGLFTSPARLLAAIMPAVLAGVPQILACRVGEEGAPVPAPLLTALELCGQESVADISREEALRLTEESLSHPSPGRILCLGEAPGLETLFSRAAARGVPVWTAPPLPRIGVTPAARAALQEDGEDGFGHLAFAQPDAELLPLDASLPPGSAPFSCVLCDAGEEEEWLLSAPLVLTPGQEGCWVWPDLAPAFFLESRLSLM